MSNNPPDMKIRLSSVLRRQVEEAARANNRTLNSEIISRLERTFREEAEVASGGMKWLATVKKSSAARIESRLAAVETAVRAVTTDDRIEKIGERMTALEKRIGRAS